MSWPSSTSEHLQGSSPASCMPYPNSNATGQALAADTRRQLWFAHRQHVRQLRRWAWARNMQTTAHGGAGGGAAQAPGPADALLPVADAAISLGMRVGDGFLGLWDHALAMMPEGAAPAWASQALRVTDSIHLLQMELLCSQAAATRAPVAAWPVHVSTGVASACMPA